MPTHRPDYSRLRRDTPFTWQVSSSIYALLYLTDTPMGAYNLDPGVCIEVYRKGRPLFRELFPDAAHIPLPGLHTPAVSYGHVNGLGSTLLFPENGEVGHTHLYESLEQGIRALEQPVDFAAAGMAPFFLEFRRRLQDAFPGEGVGFSYGLEGPLTTAWSLRGEGIFYDLMDRPELTREFLRRVTASILDFWTFTAGVQGVPVVNPEGSGLCDDIAGMVPASRFSELVLPFWEQYYRGRTTGRRSAHVEDLREEQLPFLEEIGLSSFDPSISPKLDPVILSRACRVPFAWRLGSYHYLTMSEQDVADWVFQAVADGASRLFTIVEHILCEPEHVSKVSAFIRAASEAQRILDHGGSRKDVGALVSAAGRKRFWAQWPEQGKPAEALKA